MPFARGTTASGWTSLALCTRPHRARRSRCHRASSSANQLRTLKDRAPKAVSLRADRARHCLGGVVGWSPASGSFAASRPPSASALLAPVRRGTRRRVSSPRLVASRSARATSASLHSARASTPERSRWASGGERSLRAAGTGVRTETVPCFLRWLLPSIRCRPPRCPINCSWRGLDDALLVGDARDPKSLAATITQHQRDWCNFGSITRAPWWHGDVSRGWCAATCARAACLLDVTSAGNPLSLVPATKMNCRADCPVSRDLPCDVPRSALVAERGFATAGSRDEDAAAHQCLAFHGLLARLWSGLALGRPAKILLLYHADRGRRQGLTLLCHPGDFIRSMPSNAQPSSSRCPLSEVP